MAEEYLLFDIGGTKTRLATSGDFQNFSEPVILDTPADFDEGIKQISEKAKEIADGQIKHAAGGLAGHLNREKTGIVRAPNLKEWGGRNFVEAMSQALTVPVNIENDTAIVGLGEAVVGPGKDYDIVVYITISTGVNGAKISGKAIDENIYGFEIGHQIIDFDNSQNIGSSGKGELEDFISGRETEKRFGMHPKEIPDKNVWEVEAKWAAYGVFNTLLHWSPEIFIFGGSMMNDIKVESIRANLKSLTEGLYDQIPEMVHSELGSVGGIHGALHYLRGIVESD